MAYNYIKNISIIKSQPKHTTHPSQYLGYSDFEALLDANNSTPGFEIVADSNLFQVKRRQRGKESWQGSSLYDIYGDNSQSLFLALRELQPSCCPISGTSVLVSSYTDSYKDSPVFITHINCSSGIHQEICKLTTESGLTIGTISKSIFRSPYNIFSEAYYIKNHLDDAEYTLTYKESTESSIVQFEVRLSSASASDIKLSISLLNRLATLTTADSVSCDVKIILLGLIFYMLEIQRYEQN